MITWQLLVGHSSWGTVGGGSPEVEFSCSGKYIGIRMDRTLIAMGISLFIPLSLSLCKMKKGMDLFSEFFLT